MTAKGVVQSWIGMAATVSFLASSLLTTACAIEEDVQVGEATRPTTASGAVGVILANSHLGEGEVEVKWEGHKAKAEGDLRLVMQQITIQLGGHSGWHTHGGLALASIAEGTLTLFDEHDPCSGEEFPAGTAFLDPGDGHIHIARNLGTVPMVVRVQYVLPDGAPVRIDVPAPAGADGC